MNRAMRLLPLGAFLLLTGCRTTNGTEVGIKVYKVFGADKVVTPGTTVTILPIIHDWYVFDTKTQTLEMSGEDELQFKTRDGNDIAVDVTILYRLDATKAPEFLRTVDYSMEEARQTVVRPVARSVPRDALNELSSEEFYDSDLRGKKEELALERLAIALAPYHIVVERVVLGNYRFHKPYQDAIDAKKVADQNVNRNRSQADASGKEWERNLEKTKGEVGQRIASERGKAEQVHLQADAYFAARELEAGAILTEKTANAKGIQKLKEAMSGAGGRTMVKLKIAEALKGKRIVLFPTSDGAMNIQKTDVNEFMKTMGLDGQTPDVKPPTRKVEQPAIQPGGGN